MNTFGREKRLLNSGAVDNMGATFSSDVIMIGGSSLAVEIWSNGGTHVGTLQLDVSVTGDRWEAYAFSDGTTTVAVANGAAVDEFWNLTNIAATRARVTYTRTSDNGQLDIAIAKKE